MSQPSKDSTGIIKQQVGGRPTMTPMPMPYLPVRQQPDLGIPGHGVTSSTMPLANGLQLRTNGQPGTQLSMQSPIPIPAATTPMLPPSMVMPMPMSSGIRGLTMPSAMRLVQPPFPLMSGTPTLMSTQAGILSSVQPSTRTSLKRKPASGVGVSPAGPLMMSPPQMMPSLLPDASGGQKRRKTTPQLLHYAAPNGSPPLTGMPVPLPHMPIMRTPGLGPPLPASNLPPVQPLNDTSNNSSPSPEPLSASVRSHVATPHLTPLTAAMAQRPSPVQSVGQITSTILPHNIAPLPSVASDLPIQPRSSANSTSSPPLKKRALTSFPLAQPGVGVPSHAPSMSSTEALARAHTHASRSAPQLPTVAPQRGQLADIAARAAKEDPKKANQTLRDMEREYSKCEARLSEIYRTTGRKVNRGPEPPRKKVHHDYLLEEAFQMQKDFDRERRWKRAQARRLSKAVLGWHRKNATKGVRDIQEMEASRRKTAKSIANLVRNGFWKKISKLAKLRAEAELKERRKEAYSKSLNELVESSEKFSTMVANKMIKVEAVGEDGQVVSVPSESPESRKQESEMLQKESSMSIDDLVPKGYVPVEQRSEPSSDAESLASEVSEAGNGPKGSDSAMSEDGSVHIGPSTNAEVRNACDKMIHAQPRGTTINTSPVETPVPELLRGTLREYQHIGLDWLVSLHENGMNGILADEMGLGKTIQTIALFAHLACAKKNWGPHLVVVPTSVLINWEMEFKRFLPGFKILAYYGSANERKEKRKGWSTPNRFHVVITSYNVVVQDQVTFRRRAWEYLVLDEAHHIKNFKSKKWQTLLGFNTTHRLLLTGTPLQNNVLELWSLMHFLMPNVFQSQLEFREWFDDPMAGMMAKSQEFRNSTIVQRLHTILRPFLLRRLKRDVAKQLPHKYEHVIRCKLSLRQRRLYDDFMHETRTRETLAGGSFMGMMSILMQLRKVCNHPDLFEGRPILSPFDMEAILYSTSSQAFRALEYTPFERVCMNFVNLLLISSEKFSTTDVENIRKLQTPAELIQKRADYIKDKDLTSIEEFVSLFSAVPISRPSDERKGSDAEQKVYQNAQKCDKPPPVFGENLIRLLYLDKAVADVHKQSNDEQKDAPDAIKDIVKLPEQRSIELSEMIRNFVCLAPPARAPPPKPHVSHPSPSETAREADEKKIISAELSSPSEPFHEAFVRTQLYFPDKRLIQWDCGKLQRLDKLLRRLQSGGHRVLIFTQMTKVLDILEAFLNVYGYRYLRLDGSTKIEQRGIYMERFNRDDSIFVFILSTRSGGLGINLTGADTVVFYDTDWNPAIDLQAQDRCHRIGQTREVNIYRLISENTVEENILKKAEQKKLLNAAVIGDGGFTRENLQNTIDPRELLGLPPLATDGSKLEQPRSSRDVAQAMAQVEDESDRLAGQQCQAEIERARRGEVAEFTDARMVTEAVPAGSEPAAADPNSVVAFTKSVKSALTPIELYALNYNDFWICREQVPPAPARAAVHAKGRASPVCLGRGVDEDRPWFYLHPDGSMQERFEEQAEFFRRQGISIRSELHGDLGDVNDLPDELYTPPRSLLDENWSFFDSEAQLMRLVGRKPRKRKRLDAYRASGRPSKQARRDISEAVAIQSVSGLAAMDESLAAAMAYEFKTTPAPDVVRARQKVRDRAEATEARQRRGRRRGSGAVGGSRSRADSESTVWTEEITVQAKPLVIRIPWSFLEKRFPNRMDDVRKAVRAGGPANLNTPRATRARSAVDLRRTPLGRRKTRQSVRLEQRKKKAAAQVAAGLGEGMYVRHPVFFTADEDRKLLELRAQFGANWALVADVLNNDAFVRGRLRSEDQCRRRVQELEERKLPEADRSAAGRVLIKSADSAAAKVLDMMRKYHASQAAGAAAPTRSHMELVKAILRNESVSFQSSAVYPILERAMKAVNAQRQACKNALRASLAELPDTSAKAIMQVVHPSHQKALTAGRSALGVPISVNICKTLTPKQIIELRQRRTRHLVRRNLHQRQLLSGAYGISPAELQQRLQQQRAVAAAATGNGQKQSASPSGQNPAAVAQQARANARQAAPVINGVGRAANVVQGAIPPVAGQGFPPLGMPRQMPMGASTKPQMMFGGTNPAMASGGVSPLTSNFPVAALAAGGTFPQSLIPNLGAGPAGNGAMAAANSHNSQQFLRYVVQSFPETKAQIQQIFQRTDWSQADKIAYIARIFQEKQNNAAAAAAARGRQASTRGRGAGGGGRTT
eukprot:200160_1